MTYAGNVLKLLNGRQCSSF